MPTDITDTKKNSSRLLSSPVIAAIITGVFSLLSVALGFWIATQSRQPESYEIRVDSTTYPFPSTNIQIKPGDEIEIRVLEANSTLISCVGSDRCTSAIGMVEDQAQKSAVFPKANFCSLVGQVGDGPYFVIGAYYKSSSEVSGKLSLGINDIPPNSCPILPKEMCFKDNEGKLSVSVTIQRK